MRDIREAELIVICNNVDAVGKGMEELWMTPEMSGWVTCDYEYIEILLNNTANRRCRFGSKIID